MITEERIKELVDVGEAVADKFYAECSPTLMRSPVSSVMLGPLYAWAIFRACKTPEDFDWYKAKYRTCAGCEQPLTVRNDGHAAQGNLCESCVSRARFDAQCEQEEHDREREAYLATLPPGFRKGKPARRRRAFNG